eukprot:4651878-Pyramimonas_sp.AAC.1
MQVSHLGPCGIPRILMRPLAVDTHTLNAPPRGHAGSNGGVRAHSGMRAHWGPRGMFTFASFGSYGFARIPTGS